jgi:hypothetical protein
MCFIHGLNHLSLWMGGCFYAGKYNEGAQVVNEILSKKLLPKMGWEQRLGNHSRAGNILFDLPSPDGSSALSIYNGGLALPMGQGLKTNFS